MFGWLSARLPKQNPQEVVLSPKRVGASTGYMVDERGSWPDLVSFAERVSEAVVELSALSASELPGLIAYLKRSPDLKFVYMSVHGPSKGHHGPPQALAETLAALPLQVQGIVMHPETLDDPFAFRVVGERLLLENMDRRKDDARTVEELAPYFDALPEARFCFDIAHAFHCDPTMRLARELLDAFGDRLQEVHLSSIEPSGKHVPLSEHDAATFAPLLALCTHVPWILEAQPPSWLPVLCDIESNDPRSVDHPPSEDREIARPALHAFTE
jgi:hypothetical protein